jgi:hypothetical protein
MDKFDEMMRLLKEKNPGSFGQVLAVDREFELFSRAWCVAEIAEAHKSRIRQSLLVASVDNFDEHYEKVIETIDVRRCSASRPEDKAFILEKIEKFTSIEIFNTDLRKLVGGIAFQWLREKYRKLRKDHEFLDEYPGLSGSVTSLIDCIVRAQPSPQVIGSSP